VADEFDRRLDWSLASLDELDAVCADLLADGSLDDDRLDLWWLLIGSYAGEVLVRHFDGEWVPIENSPDGPAVSALGVTAFPFSTVKKILHAEPTKSLGAFGRTFPVIAALF
jgi:hypothetical protein